MKKRILNVILSMLVVIAVIFGAMASTNTTANAKQTTTTYERVCNADGSCYTYVYEDGVLQKIIAD